jgi:hypothetical protein
MYGDLAIFKNFSSIFCNSFQITIELSTKIFIYFYYILKFHPQKMATLKGLDVVKLFLIQVNYRENNHPNMVQVMVKSK